MFIQPNVSPVKVAANTWGIMTYSQTTTHGYWHWAADNTTALAALSNSTRPPTQPDTWDKFLLGAYNSGGTPTGHWFDGYMDELRISSIARYGGTGTYTNPGGAEFVNDSDTVGLWHFNNSLADSSGNGNTFTGVNTIFSTTSWRGSHSLEFNGSNAYAYLPAGAVNIGPTRAGFNSTGSLVSTAETAPSSTTKMSGVILYKDNAGTNTLGTDLKIYFSADNGDSGNWHEAASYGTVSPVFSTGVKMVRLGETTVTSGSTCLIKAVWANQVESSKEVQLHGWAMNY